ncbi:hypothetical protein HFP05_00900 [Rhodanobacter denitrificans]|nr:hypothetical protein [Rhodanobacter denitrificans]
MASVSAGLKRTGRFSASTIIFLARRVSRWLETRMKWWPGTESNRRHGDFQRLTRRDEWRQAAT